MVPTPQITRSAARGSPLNYWAVWRVAGRSRLLVRPRRPHHPLVARCNGLAGALAVAALIAGCGASSAKPKMNFCGPLYVLHGHRVRSNTMCGGVVGAPNPVKVNLGERFTVIGPLNRSFGSTLEPRGQAVRLIFTDGNTTTYQAVHEGRSALVSRTPYCERPRRRRCTAFLIIVS